MHGPRKGRHCPLTRESIHINYWVKFFRTQLHILRGSTQTFHLKKLPSSITPPCLFLSQMQKYLKLSLLNFCWSIYLLTPPHIFHTVLFLLLFPSTICMANHSYCHVISPTLSKGSNACNKHTLWQLLLPMLSIGADTCGSNHRNQNCNLSTTTVKFQMKYHHCTDGKDGWKKNGLFQLLSLVFRTSF